MIDSIKSDIGQATTSNSTLDILAVSGTNMSVES